jgi:acyl phosphate:glycerol-3-phosphate acyltransferase
MSHPAVFVAIAFLSGSIPFGLLIGRAKGIDIRQHGSGNIGATNVGRVLGRKYFILCFTLDLLKGLLPTLVAGFALGRLGSFGMPAADAWWWLLAMVSAVLGHVFTPWLGFRGGKGVATALGAMLGVFPVLTVAGVWVFLVWLLALVAWRTISISSMVAGVLLPAVVLAEFYIARKMGWLSLREGQSAEQAAWPFLTVACLLAALVVWTHRGNIKRLRAGTEPKVGQRARQAPNAT